MRAVTPWAATAQATKAVSTTAAKGLSDQEPKELVTAVVTGSRSVPATTPAGSGWARVTAMALAITSAPTLSRAIQIARGTWRPASCVSSATPTAQSKPMKTQPPTASAASIAAKTESPESASAPRVSPRMEMSWSRKTSSRVSAIPTEASTSARIPARTTLPTRSMPSDPIAAATRISAIPAATIAPGSGSIPSRVSSQGAPR